MWCTFARPRRYSFAIGLSVSTEKIPCSLQTGSCSAVKIPCLVEQGISMEGVEFAQRQGAKMVGEGSELKNSLLISLFAGNLRRRRVRYRLPAQPTGAVSASHVRLPK